MRVLRFLAAAGLALAATVALVVSATMATAVQLLATSALVMGGTEHPLVPPTDQPPFVLDYLNNAVNGYLNSPRATAAGFPAVDNAVAVYTPEQFFPIAGSQTFDASLAEGRANLNRCLIAVGCIHNESVGSAPGVDDTFVVFGYSQSAVIASLVKRDLMAAYQPGDPRVPFMLVSNAMRPNGGILNRFNGFPTIPILGISFYGATPTNSELIDNGGTPDDPSDDVYAFPTVDVAQQYDAFGGDFPVRPLNPLSLVNSIAAFLMLHSKAVYQPLSAAQYQGRQGDTSYYLYPSDIVPVLKPLEMIGIPKAILSALDAPLRVIIEDGYDRVSNPGTPTPLSILPIGDPIGLVFKLLASLPVAIDNALQDVGVGRVLGTTRPGAYGVGGPALPPAPPTAGSATAISAQPPTPPVVSNKIAVSQHDSTDKIASNGAPAAQPVQLEQPAAERQSVELSPADPQQQQPEPDVAKKPRSTTDPDLPAVRGPIEFDGPVTPVGSAPSDSNDANGPGTASPVDGQSSATATQSTPDAIKPATAAPTGDQHQDAA